MMITEVQELVFQEGQTPLDLAIESGQESCASYIRAAIANKVCSLYLRIYIEITHLNEHIIDQLAGKF